MKKRGIAWGGVALAALIGVIWLGRSSLRPVCTQLEGHDQLRILANEVAPGTARFFCYSDAGAQVRFVLARDSEGKLHSILDACIQCYKFRKGFSFSGGYLVCRLCGNRYPIKTMTKGKASCVPVRLATRTTGDSIEVRTADLRAKRWLF
ncbi:MAG TPA: Fe-S-containing protein [Candidatus Binataceae bacterium]|nr:Fe-S-containing protein [Candidatus Binataceae bacterium]